MDELGFGCVCIGRLTHRWAIKKGKRKIYIHPVSYIFIRFLHVTETGYCADHYPVHALSWIPLPPLNKRVGCILRENRIDNTHIRVYIYIRKRGGYKAIKFCATHTIDDWSFDLDYISTRYTYHTRPCVSLDPRFLFFHPGGRPSLP